MGRGRGDAGASTLPPRHCSQRPEAEEHIKWSHTTPHTTLPRSHGARHQRSRLGLITRMPRFSQLIYTDKPHTQHTPRAKRAASPPACLSRHQSPTRSYTPPAPPPPLWSATQTRATDAGLCGMPACGQAVGCGVCDTSELWRGAAGLCACICACAGGAESLRTYIHTHSLRMNQRRLFKER